MVLALGSTGQIVSITSEYKFAEPSGSIVFLHISKNPFTWWKGYQKWKQLLKSYKPDILHVHLFHAWVLAWWTPKKVPIVFTLHSSKVEKYWFGAFLWMTRNKRDVDILFVENQQKKFNSPKIAVIPNGIDFAQFPFHKRTPKNKPIVLFAGRMSPEKRPKEFLEILENHIPKIHFKIWMAGNGELWSSLSSKTYSLDIHWWGNVQDIRPLMRDANLLVLPSAWEGMPIVVLEAAASGLPVLATPVGNLPELLGAERGYCTDLENFPERISHILSHPEEAQIRGQNLYHFAKSHYSLDIIQQKHQELYKSLLP